MEDMEDNTSLRNPSVVIAELQAMLADDPEIAALLAEAAQTLEYLQRGFLVKLQQHDATVAALKAEVKLLREDVQDALQETKEVVATLQNARRAYSARQKDVKDNSPWLT